MHKRRFYLPPEAISKYSDIVGPDVLHINRTLRMSVGAVVEIFDGVRYVYLARITYISDKVVRVKMFERFNIDREFPVSITLAQAFLKGKKMDGLICQLTELGLKRWVVFGSKRSIPILNKNRIAARAERWKKISIEAVKQCRRGVLPHISFLEDFESVLDLSDSNDLNVIFWEGKAYDLASPRNVDSNVKNILIVIGPEGGFEDIEIKYAKSRGFIVASLGPRILRAETATIAAVTIFQYLFGDMGKKT